MIKKPTCCQVTRGGQAPVRMIEKAASMRSHADFDTSLIPGGKAISVILHGNGDRYERAI